MEMSGDLGMAPSLDHSAARRSCDLLRLDPEVPFSHQIGLCSFISLQPEGREANPNAQKSSL